MLTCWLELTPVSNENKRPEDGDRFLRLRASKRRFGYAALLCSEVSDIDPTEWGTGWSGWRASRSCVNRVDLRELREWVARLPNHGPRYHPCALDLRHVDYLGNEAATNDGGAA